MLYNDTSTCWLCIWASALTSRFLLAVVLDARQHRLAVAVEALDGNLVLSNLLVDKQDAQEDILHLLPDAVQRYLYLLALYLGIGAHQPLFAGRRAAVPEGLAHLAHQRILVVRQVELELGYLERHLDHL